MTLQSVSAPLHPEAHLFEVAGAPHLFLANGSRVFEIDADVAGALDAAIAGDAGAGVDDLLGRYGLSVPAFVASEPPGTLPIRTLSLAVSQKCNLGCTYCYADGGSFGAAPRNMPLEVALHTVDRIFDEAPPGERLTLAFLGGEPLTNRTVLRAATEHARRRAAERQCRVGFSITTNGTLLRPEDAAFFGDHGFAVTVSLDGVGAAHDQQRPFKSGRGSFAHIVSRLEPLLAERRVQATARVTVTAANLQLRETLDGLLDLGFYGVGFAPMLRSPNGVGEADAEMLDRFLETMIDCGEECVRRVGSGERYGFLNLLAAVQEIHKGTHRPYPCGAGAGYVAASADGDLYVCHRFVGDEAGKIGDAERGIEAATQRRWLAERHVHFQQPCRSCWARYLCGGGCHHEVMGRGRHACNYIRGWLHYALGAYVRLQTLNPEMFGADMSRAR